MKKVSILIPVYNVEIYIQDCAISLFEQTYKNIEYIFVDDCSTDDSIDKLKKICASYPQRIDSIKIYQHNRNLGISAVRNTALLNSTGDYIMFVDSDDYVDRKAVEILVDYVESTSADVVICDHYLKYEDRVKYVSAYYVSNKIEYVKAILLRKANSQLWGKIYNADFLKDTGLSFVDNINYGEDFLFLSKLFYYAKNIVKINESLYYYRIRKNSLSALNGISIDSVNNLVEINLMLEKFYSNDSRFYQTIDLMKLRNKLVLLKRSRLSMYKYIVHLYPDVEKQNLSLLSITDQILLFGAKLKLYPLVYMCSKAGLLWNNYFRTNR